MVGYMAGLYVLCRLWVIRFLVLSIMMVDYCGLCLGLISDTFVLTLVRSVAVGVT